ncbi:MAG: HEPN domain-containing protein [Gemmataceae bacterium]|nr:HEPN domain-containing protein [Gemmataceae bacterium]
MDRKGFQLLAKSRLKDAKALLDKKRWAAAYYLCGYVLECALKACLLRHIGEWAALFGDPEYPRRLAACRTHDLGLLVHLAGLDAAFGQARGTNSNLQDYWAQAKDWNEASRHEERTEAEARSLFEAVSHTFDGVFKWFQAYW